MISDYIGSGFAVANVGSRSHPGCRTLHNSPGRFNVRMSFNGRIDTTTSRVIVDTQFRLPILPVSIAFNVVTL